MADLCQEICGSPRVGPRAASVKTSEAAEAAGGPQVATRAPTHGARAVAEVAPEDWPQCPAEAVAVVAVVPSPCT